MHVLRSACFEAHNPQQGTTAWAAVDVTLTAGKPSLLDSGFDRRQPQMLRHAVQ